MLSLYLFLLEKGGQNGLTIVLLVCISFGLIVMWFGTVFYDHGLSGMGTEDLKYLMCLSLLIL